MSKRFGRNQKRALQAQLYEARMNAIKAGEVTQLVEQRRQREVADLLSEAKAARMARDTIRIDVDSLVSPQDRNLQMRARFDILSKRGPELYSAIAIDERDIVGRSDIERAAFVRMVGERLAEHALHQIVQHWRSR